MILKKLSFGLIGLVLLASLVLAPASSVFAAAPTNLIANPLVETPSSTNSAMPSGWLEGSWGTNNTTFSYLKTGYNSTNSVETAMTKYTSGDAKWYFTPVNVSGSTSYSYSDYYESNVATDVMAQLSDAKGNLTYIDLGAATASTGWKQYQASFTTASTTTQVTIFHLIESVGTLTTSDFSLNLTASTSPPPASNQVPNASLTAASGTPATPTDWLEGSWGTNTAAYSYLTSGYNNNDSVKVQLTSYTSGDAKWYFQPVNLTAGTSYTYSDYYESNVATDVMVQYESTSGVYSYVDLGSAASSTGWKQYSGQFTVPAGTANTTVFHLISSAGTLTTSDFSVTASSASVAPTVSITSPAANAKLSGTTNLTASAANAASVQFEVDGTKVGSPLTKAPYSFSWNSSTVVDGTHTISAVATNAGGQSVTSGSVSVNVDNNGGNMIPNPLINIVDPANSNAPLDWSASGWGTNTAAYSYQPTGGFNGGGTAKVQITQYTSGDNKWTFPNENITPDVQYNFTDYYQSNVSTEVDAVFNMSDGTTEYQIIGLPSAATTWTKFSSDFVVPLGTQSVTIYHLINKVGTLTTSDFSMTPYTPVGFSRPLISLTFDDGYSSTFDNATPLLDQYGYKSTQFVITDLLGDTGYMTNANVQSLYSDGQEIASHTVTHDDMTTENAAQLQTEESQSQATLSSLIGAPVTDLAYPYGEYDTAVQAATMQYYTGARGVEDGLNSKDNFNAYDIKVQNMYNTTTTAQLADWIKQAQSTNTWLVIVYHSVDPNVNSPIDGSIYNVTPTQLSDQLAAIKSSGIAVETMQQALKEVEAQL